MDVIAHTQVFISHEPIYTHVSRGMSVNMNRAVFTLFSSGVSSTKHMKNSKSACFHLTTIIFPASSLFIHCDLEGCVCACVCNNIFVCVGAQIVKSMCTSHAHQLYLSLPDRPPYSEESTWNRAELVCVCVCVLLGETDVQC